MRYTTLLSTLARTAAGVFRIRQHHIERNFAAQDDALSTITRALFQVGGVALPGQVTLTGLNLRVQARVGVTLDGAVAVHVDDQTLDLTAVPQGKATVLISTDPVTEQIPFTDVGGEPLVDTMVKSLGRLVLVYAGQAGVSSDASGYPVVPGNAVPVAHVTRTAGGATLDEVLNPAILVNSSVTGPAGVSVTGAAVDAGRHLILTLSDGSSVDAGSVGSSADLPAPGPDGEVLTVVGGVWTSAAAASGGGSAGATPTRVSAGGAGSAGGDELATGKSYTLSPAPSSSFPDTGGTELTAAGPVPSGNYTANAGWVGWNSVNPDTVTLDLGDVRSVASAGLYAGAGAGYVPNSVEVFTSVDGVTYTSRGIQARTGTGDQWIRVAFATAVIARYVRYVTAGSATDWVMLGRASVLSGAALASMTGLPAGYVLRRADGVAGSDGSVYVPSGGAWVHTQNAQGGAVILPAFMKPGDVWAYPGSA